MNVLLIISIILLLPFIPITFVAQVDNFTLEDTKNYKNKIKLFFCLTNSIRFDLSFLIKRKKKSKRKTFPLLEKIFSYSEIKNISVILESNNVFSGAFLCIILDYLRAYIYTHFLSVDNEKYQDHYYEGNKFLSCFINIKIQIRTINILIAYINNEITLKQKKGKRLYVKSQN